MTPEEKLQRRAYLENARYKKKELKRALRDKIREVNRIYWDNVNNENKIIRELYLKSHPTRRNNKYKSNGIERPNFKIYKNSEGYAASLLRRSGFNKNFISKELKEVKLLQLLIMRKCNEKCK